MEDIKVSITCLAYNHEKYIRNTLEGFVKQKTNFKYEVIIHDDASKDNTAKIIKEYEEKYPDIIKPIYQKKNQFSQGIDIFAEHIFPKAKGKYIASCEGDDFWVDENKLQKQYDALENNPNCSMCVHSVELCNEKGKLIDMQLPNKKLGFNTGIIKSDRIIDIILGNHSYMTYPFQTSCYFYKRNYCDNMYKVNYDFDLVLSSAAHGDFYFYEEAMSCYRVNSIGSFNTKIKQGNFDKKNEVELYFVKNILAFDKYTKQKYHEMVLRNINFRMAVYIPVYTKEVKSFIKENHINLFTIIKYARPVSGAKYFVKRYLNPIYKLYRKIIPYRY